MEEKQLERLKEIIDNTIEMGLKIDSNLENLEYYNMFCKAAAKNHLFKLFGNNLCMFTTMYENKEALLVLFSIPINSDESGAKGVAERVMEVIFALETCLVTLDYVKSEEVKEDKFVYVSIIKIIEGEKSNETKESKVVKEKPNKRKPRATNKN
jgi:hypothetical protein